MKIEKSNNPAAAGVLIVVLVLIVGRIGWMLFGQNKAASAASTVAKSSSAPTADVNASPDSATTRPQMTMALSPLSASARETARNPFAYSGSIRPSQASMSPDVASHGHEVDHAKRVQIPSLPPLSVWAEKQGAAGGVGQASAFSVPSAPPLPTGQSVSSPTSSGISPPPNPLQTLKLTAIVDGKAPMAILQTARPEPIILHVGDVLDGMRVSAINENDMIFAREGSRWTLPLQSAADSPATEPIAANSATAPEEETDEKQ